MPVVNEIFDDFCHLDMWPFLERYATMFKEGGKEVGLSKIRFIRAGRNNAWTPRVMERFDYLKYRSEGGIVVQKLEGVGHWLHTENPTGVLEMMTLNGL
jgi:hypothetical protein